MDVRVLGPVRLGGPSGERVVAGRQRLILARLAVDAPNTVSTDALVDAMWPEQRPRNPANALQVGVSQLRKLFDPAARGELIVTRETGYALQVTDETLDARRFESLAAQAREHTREGRHDLALSAAEVACALWRGQAFEGLADEGWARVEVARLDELRLQVTETRIAALLELGRQEQVIGELEELVRRHPSRERLRGQLMVALYRAGRQADALAAHAEGRRFLAEELGLDPDPLLTDLERRILAHDPTLLGPAAPSALPDTPPAPAPGEAPRQRDVAVVGRQRELAQLLAATERAAQGRGGLMLVEGEAGAGKSFLVDAFAEELARRRTRRALGRCVEGVGAPAFWPWVQVIRWLVDQSDADEVSAALGSAADELAEVVPELRELVGPAPASAEGSAADARFRAVDGVARIVCRLAGQQPLVIVIEDLHLADAPSIEVLTLLVDELGSRQITVVGTVRTDDPASAAGPSGQPLRQLRQHPAADRILLPALSADAVAELVERVMGRRPDDDLVAGLVKRTGGNALFVTELLRLIESDPGVRGRAESVIAASDLTAVARLPAGITELIDRRLDGLPDDTLLVLRAAAVVGVEVWVEVLVAMLDVDAATVLERLEPAFEGRVLEPDPDRVGGIRFVHALVRDALVGALPMLERARLHLAAGTAIAARGDDRHAGAVAHHLQRALPLGDVGTAVDAAVRASDQARRAFAFEQAERLLLRALEMLERSGGDVDREIAVQARLTALLTATEGFTSRRIEAAATRVRELSSRLDRAPEAAGVAWSMWAYWINRARLDLAEELAAELRQQGERLDDDVLRATGHMTVGTTAFHRGRFTEAVHHLDRSRELVADLAAASVADRGLGLMALNARVATCHPYWAVGRSDDAERAALTGLRMAEQQGEVYEATHARLFLAWLAALRGDAETCLAWTQDGLAAAEEHQFPLIATLTRAFAGWATAAVGDPATGTSMIDRSLNELDTAEFTMLRPLHLDLRADALARAGRHGEAHETVRAALSVSRSTGECFHLAPLLARQGEIALAQGDVAAAHAAVSESVRVASEQEATHLEQRARTALEEIQELT